jgi:hypothetical protein
MIIFGQRNYFTTGTQLSVGIKLVEGSDLSNARFCQLIKGDSLIVYTPYEVIEYGFKDGRVYISKMIKTADSTHRVFLKRLVKGNITLYSYKGPGIKTYFLEKDSTFFIELPNHNEEEKDSYKNTLLNLTKEWPGASVATKLVTYNKSSLSALIESYNSCELKPFPFFKYGILAGYGMDKLILSSDLGNEYFNQFKYKYEGGIVLGCFVDKPLHSRVFSLRAEIIYMQNGFSYNYIDGNKDMDIVINTASLNFPILVRYTYPSLRSRPFINIGGVYAYNFKNQSAFYEANINGSIIEINKDETTLISQRQIGLVFGGGFQFNLDYRKSVFVEFRCTKLFGNSNSELFNKNQIQLLTGINF